MLCPDLPQGLQFVYSFDEPRDITGLGIGIDTSIFAGSMVQKGLNPYTSFHVFHVATLSREDLPRLCLLVSLRRRYSVNISCRPRSTSVTASGASRPSRLNKRSVSTVRS